MNNNPFSPKDKNDAGSLREQMRITRKSAFSQLHPLLGDGTNSNDENFEKHAERMLIFRKSHVLCKKVDITPRMEEPTLTIEGAISESCDSNYLHKIDNWLLIITENKELHHQFSVN